MIKYIHTTSEHGGIEVIKGTNKKSHYLNYNGIRCRVFNSFGKHVRTISGTEEEILTELNRLKYSYKH